MAKTKERNIISDKLLIEKTKKPMEDWFKVLDKKGAKKMSHAQIFGLVSAIPGLKPLGEWNHNLLTTTYEWDRGIKERGQKENGFEISVSKTVDVPIELLYNSLIEDKSSKKWLKENIVIRKTTESKSARITWCDKETSLSIDFYTKGQNRSQIVVQHLKISDSKKAAQLKEFWSETLDKLKNLLEK